MWVVMLSEVEAVCEPINTANPAHSFDSAQEDPSMSSIKIFLN